MAIVETREQIEIEIEDRILYEDPREHIGASSIGGECKRKSWYAFRWCVNIGHLPRKRRLFDRGHMEEIVIIEDLINAGCKVENAGIDRSIQKRFKTVFGLELPETVQLHRKFAHGHGGSSYDAAIYNLPGAPKTPHLLEAKTANLKNFEKVKRLGVKAGNYVHFVQMQIYMFVFKFKRSLYVVTHKDTDRRYYERVKFDKKVAKKYIQLALSIISMEQPPKRMPDQNGREFWQCPYCDFYNICKKDSSLDKNCRTCKNVGIRDEGRWICELTRNKLKYKKQRKGCPKYKMMRIL